MAIYMWRDLITTAGIYHNSDLGLISLSSDGSNWITISDKNLGATDVYNNGDTLSEANCGKFYQRGNNYGFSRSGTITTSSTKVNASNYGPNNYYSSSTFITASSSPYTWDTSNNANLWGDTTNTNEARKGPCNTGYHIPTQTEWQNVFDMGNTWGIWSNSSGTGMRDYLKLPTGGWRNQAGELTHAGSRGDYRCSSVSSGNESYYLFIQTNSARPNYSGMTVSGISIRPFANTPTQPDNTRTVIYQPS